MMEPVPALSNQDAAFLKSLSVLYVEDDDRNREGLNVFLRRRVGSVVLASNGAQGLAAFQASPSQLVVTDIQMPVMDGLAMARAIRNLNPQVPIIVTTAFEQTDYLLRAIELGIDHYVLKPIQGAQLESALLACAHRLMAEEQLRLKEALQAEAARNRHHAAMHVLFAGIAHDYNNLLQSVFASIELAATKTRGDEDLQRLLNLASNGSEEIRELSRRLALLSDRSFAAGRVGPVDDLLRPAVEAALQGTPCQARLSLPPTPVAVRHHPDNLAMAFGNIAENAREAMPEGGTLEVSADRLDLPAREDPSLPAGPFLRIRFKDHGRGILPEDLPRIFDPYFSTKERGRQRGMGLGLALTEAVVRAHGGAITAESTPGSGTTVEVLLPLSDPA